MTTRPAKPTVRYSAIKSARTVGSANVELHHHGGRDPFLPQREARFGGNTYSNVPQVAAFGDQPVRLRPREPEFLRHCFLRAAFDVMHPSRSQHQIVVPLHISPPSAQFEKMSHE